MCESFCVTAVCARQVCFLFFAERGGGGRGRHFSISFVYGRDLSLDVFICPGLYRCTAVYQMSSWRERQT